jgi:UDP-glucose 4-epimerase
MKLPDLYLKVNFEATKNLIDLAIKFGIENFVFSSSSSVYGDLNESYLSEDIPPNPISPYGLSKLLAESYLKEKVLMREIRGISLRYFNVVGTFSEALADRSKRNLFPLFHKAFREQGQVCIYGNDYPTPDGTCIRDYIHVLDVAGMHVEIMKDISKFGDPVLNLGRGSGLSVYQIYQAFTQYYKKELPIKWLPRRPGDPATVIGDVSRLQKKYGIFPKYNLADMVSY